MSNCLFYFQQFPSFNTEHVQFTPELGVAILTVHEISHARSLLERIIHRANQGLPVHSRVLYNSMGRRAS